MLTASAPPPAAFPPVSQPYRPLKAGQSRAVVAGIIGAHLAGVWLLLQVEAVRTMVVEAAPLLVQTIAPAAPPEPPAPALPPPPQARPPMPALAPVPEVAVNVPTAPPAPPPASVVSDAPPPPPAPTPPAPVIVAAAPVAPAPPAARSIPASALQYLVPPQLEYPRVSRRQRETGKALVRVLIDEAGMPRTVELEKSTGFPLLDQAALAAVRKARFKPYTENGQPQAGWAVIPLSFDLDS